MTQVSGIVGATPRKGGRIGIETAVCGRPVAALDPAQVVLLIGNRVAERVVVPIVVVKTACQRDVQRRRRLIVLEARRTGARIASVVVTRTADTQRIAVRATVGRRPLTRRQIDPA